MTLPTNSLFQEAITLDNEFADWRSRLSGSPVVLWSLVAILMAGIFAADLFTPIGFAVWILYIVVILLAAQSPEVRHVRAVAFVCSLAIAIDFFLSPQFAGFSAWMAASNRAVGILAVWVTSFLGSQCTIAEKRERTGRRLLLTTLKSIGDGVVTTDAQGRVIFLNPVAEGLVGWTTAQAAGRPLPEIFHIVNEKTRREVENPALRALKEGVVVGLANHTVLISRDGTERPIDDSASPVRASDGSETGAVLVFRDITERKRAEQAVLESREQLNVTLSSIGDAVVATDRQGRVTFLNRVAEELLGTSSEHAVGRPLAETFRIINEDTRQPAESPVARVLSEGKIAGLANHTLLIRSDGKEMPIDDSAAPIRDGLGNIRGVVLVFRDITARKQGERERGTLAAIVTSSEDAIVSKDLDGRIMTWNRGAEEIFGYSADEIIGKPITVLFPPERMEEETEILSRVRRGERLEHYETIRLKKDGTPIHISVSVSPVKDETGRIVGAAKIARDITDRIRAEQELRESRERLSVTLSSIGDAVVATDSAGRVTFLNPVARDLLGYTVEQAAGRALGEIFRIVNEETRRPVQSPVDRVLREGKVVGLANHTVLLRSDGSEVPIDDSAAPIRGADGRLSGVVLVFRDITERKQAEQALLEANRRKDHFLAILAHELRNPLAPIRNAVQILQLKVPRENDLIWCCDLIERQIAQMARLLDDLLDISRITRGKLELRKKRIELSSIMRNAIETSGPYIEDRRQELAVQWPSEPLWVDADATRMAQVFSNLLNNAAKYTGTGGRIEIRLERQRDHGIVTVRDTGRGISPDLLPRIFDMFIQGENTMEDSQGGLGLGLTLARDIVETHGGSIAARSEGPGRGSEFVVRLPVAPDQAHVAVHTEPAPPAAAAPHSKRILIVDDNRNQARTLSMLLKTLGHEVSVAYDGPSALELAAEFHPDVALIDIGLPGMSGYDLARHIRQQPEFRDVILVAQTGWGREEDRQRAVEAGFNHHLVKPIDRERFRDILAQPKVLDN